MNGTGKYRTKRRITGKFAVCTEEGEKSPSFFVARHAIKQSGDCFERTGIRRDGSLYKKTGKSYYYQLCLRAKIEKGYLIISVYLSEFVRAGA